MKKLLWLLTVLFAIAISLTGIRTSKQIEELLIAVSISADELEECILGVASNDSAHYIFLPSYAGTSDARFSLDTSAKVCIDGTVIEDGMSCGMFLQDVAYPMEYTSWGKKQEGTLTFVRSGGVATMYVDTRSGVMEIIHAEKGNEETGSVRLYTPEGELHFSGALESIKGRGNYTWEAYEKKPYSLKFAEEVDLLGMGAAQRWALLANADDASNIRNALVHDYADAAGLEFSANSRWVDLYLNGEYAGLYQLSEKNEVHSERVNISDEDSFLVSAELEERLVDQNYAYVKTNNEQALRVHYPVTFASSHNDWLRSRWQEVEDAIVDPDGSAWTDMIDLDSWARKYLIEEIFANCDACFISQYYYQDGVDGKVFAGPVWDYDHSIGWKAAWQFTIPNSFYANRLHVKDGYDAPWFHALYQKEEFYDRVVELYETEFLPLLQVYLEEKIDEYCDEIAVASEANRIRWGIETDIYEEAEYIRSYLARRLEFLSDVWINGNTYHTVMADQGFGGFYAYYAVPDGACIETLPVIEDTPNQAFAGWVYTDSGEAFDETKPITEDISIRVKWTDTDNRRLGQIAKMTPLGIFALVFITLFIVDVRRNRKVG